MFRLGNLYTWKKNMEFSARYKTLIQDMIEKYSAQRTEKPSSYLPGIQKET